VLPKLTVYAGVSSLAIREWPHLRGLELADPDFAAADKIDLLLGADVYASILGAGVRKGGAREPVAQQTSIGWIISGTVGALSSHAISFAAQCSVDEPLSILVRQFWEQEEVKRSAPVLTLKERDCEELFVTTHSRNSEGRYIVRLPVISTLPDLSTTRKAASSMLLAMERRFIKDASLEEEYKRFMREYERLGHMTRVEPAEEDAKRVCYLPHHGVLRETSSTTKLRVVFNGSVEITGGESLNKNMLIGQNLLPPLADVLLRWRWHRYVFVADIEKMYRQILVHPSDRDLQRIVWRYNTTDRMAEYQLNTVTYGLGSAPFLAIRTLLQLADDEEPRFPFGASILRRDVYMDDILSGADTVKQAQELLRQVTGLCTAGGFPLKKWAANERIILDDVPAEDLSQPGTRSWLPYQSHATLGLQWHPCTDDFSVALRPGEIRLATKRSVLSQAARLFDPLGWLAPVVVRAKIFIQSTWLKSLDWDTPLSSEDSSFWRDFLEELPSLAQVRIPR